MPSEPTERRVRHFQDELDQLTDRLLAMGGLAEERLRATLAALVDRDAGVLDGVMRSDQPINDLHVEIDTRCFRMLALYQPMATDLRAIVAGVKINTDIERIGDLVVNIAEAAARYLRHAPVKELVDLPRMGAIAQRMVRDALDAYVRRDIEIAQAVLRADDGLDALKTQVFRDVLALMLQSAQVIEPSLDLILISRHLERIGDHATNIAEDVIFMVSARDVRHHGPAPGLGAEATPPRDGHAGGPRP